jgi:hypothetical protein
MRPPAVLTSARSASLRSSTCSRRGSKSGRDHEAWLRRDRSDSRGDSTAGDCHLSGPVQRFLRQGFSVSVGAGKTAGQGPVGTEGPRSRPFCGTSLIGWRNSLQTRRSEPPQKGISCKAPPDTEGIETRTCKNRSSIDIGRLQSPARHRGHRNLRSFTNARHADAVLQSPARHRGHRNALR